MRVLTDETPTKEECCYRCKYNTCEFKGTIRWCVITTDEKCPFCIGMNDFLNEKAVNFENDS
jgi:hypothetical protein